MRKIKKDTVNKSLITNYITDNNLSKTKFCQICKISPSTLNKILNDKDCRITALFKIARMLNIRIHLLFNNTKEI